MYYRIWDRVSRKVTLYENIFLDENSGATYNVLHWIRASFWWRKAWFPENSVRNLGFRFLKVLSTFWGTPYRGYGSKFIGDTKLVSPIGNLPGFIGDTGSLPSGILSLSIGDIPDNAIRDIPDRTKAALIGDIPYKRKRGRFGRKNGSGNVFETQSPPYRLLIEIDAFRA